MILNRYGLGIYDNFAVGLHDRIFQDDLADAVGHDFSGGGVFHRIDLPGYRGVDLGVFEGQVGALHGAVHEGQIFAVAKGLGADDLAVDQGQPFRIPSQIFAPDGAVFDGDVLAVPEGVFRVEIAVFHRHIFGILEGIFPLQGDVVQPSVFGFEQEILGGNVTIFHFQASAAPAEFVGDDIADGEGHILAFPQGFRAVQVAVGDLASFCVPQGGPDVFVHGDMLRREIFRVPEGVPQGEPAMGHRHVFRFLQGRFPVGGAGEYAMLHRCVLQGVQRPFFVHGLMGNDGQNKFLDFIRDFPTVYHFSERMSRRKRGRCSFSFGRKKKNQKESPGRRISSPESRGGVGILFLSGERKRTKKKAPAVRISSPESKGGVGILFLSGEGKRTKKKDPAVRKRS